MLSEDEIYLLGDADTMLKKRLLTEKIATQLEVIGQKLVENMTELDKLPSDAFDLGPKVSKGENYKGLPYLVLDYPRLYSKEDILAFRVMVWWGKHISAFMHLKGRYLNSVPLSKELFHSRKTLYYVTGHDEWEHEKSAEHYTQIDAGSFPPLNPTFLKVGHFLEIEHFNHLEAFVLESWRDTMVKVYDLSET